VGCWVVSIYRFGNGEVQNDGVLPWSDRFFGLFNKSSFPYI